ncbi:MAG: hypothetical protein JNJ54_35005 [Myxococcaceae bacterium]|nr:hypothetical protein [Myxococcaceae bacterium]
MARTASTQAIYVLANPNHGGAVTSFLVYSSSGGASRELRDWVVDAEVQEDLDSPRTATIRLVRRKGYALISPLVVSTAVIGEEGTALNFSGTEPVVAAGRRVKLSAALVIDSAGQHGTRDAPIDALLLFDGFIDEVQWADEEVVLTCTDRWAKLRDTWIETERAYGFAQGANATRGCIIWRNDLEAVSLNELVVPSALKRNGHFYKATTVSGAQGTTEPAWPTGSGATVVSGGVTFTEAGSTSDTTGTAVQSIIQQLIDDNLGSGYTTVQCPVSPSWNVKPWLQERTSVLDAVKRLGDQLGWELRFAFSAGAFNLTLRAPARTSPGATRTFSEDYVRSVSEAAVKVFDVRNVVRVTYNDSSALAAEGRPRRKFYVASDSSSIAKYGRRFMEIQEADSSNIDTSAEAQRMAEAIRDDLKDPLVEVAIATPFDPYLEVNDYLTLPADQQHWAVQQLLAVQGFTHRVSGGGSETSLRLRAKGAAAFDRWHERDGRADRSDLHLNSLLNNVNVATMTPEFTVSGTKFSITQTLAKNALNQNFELHVAPTAGFTPSASTLKSAGQSTSHVVSSLVPGKTYYSKAIPYSKNGDRHVYGEASDEVSFVASRALCGHYDSKSTQSHLPLNGNFEHASDDLASNPVDHWQLSTLPAENAEEWSSSGSVYYGTDTNKGRYIALRAHASKRGSLLSSAFEVRRGLRNFNIYLSIRRQAGSGVGSPYDLIVDVWGFSDAALTTQIINYSVTLSGDSAGPYPTLNTWYDTVIDFGSGYGTIPSNVNFLQLRLRRATAGSTAVSWDVGDIYVQEADFHRARIDQDPWIGAAALFGANWQNWGAPFANAAYSKDSLGIVRLRGLVQTTVVRAGGSIPFTLPSGYRPPADEAFSAVGIGAGGFVRVDVQANGQVVISPAVPVNEWVSLSGISFATQ